MHIVLKSTFFRSTTWSQLCPEAMHKRIHKPKASLHHLEEKILFTTYKIQYFPDFVEFVMCSIRQNIAKPYLQNSYF